MVLNNSIELYKLADDSGETKNLINSENPLETNITDNLISPKYFQITTAIKKYWRLASYPLYLFL